MSADIGVRIGVDGEREFKASLSAVNAEIKNLNSEMRSVAASFAGMEDSEEAVAAQGDVLQRSIAATGQKVELLSGQYNRAKDRLSQLGAELDRVTAEFGANSAEASRAQNAYNRQVAAVNNLGSQINGATADMSRMQRELDGLGNAANAAGEDLSDAGRDASTFGESLKGAFMGGVVAGAVQSLVSGMAALVEETTEYRKIMGTLEVSSQKAGYTTEQTAQSYNQLYGILGDSQTAATALANLQALGLSQEALTQLTDEAIGAWATYGDSIPIDGLAEAINETVKAGAVTGTFADVLNWAGTSEDDFNEKLEACASQSERVDLIMQELANQGLMQAAEGWRENNAEIVNANLAAAGLEETTGRIGEMLSPVVTKAKEGLNEVLKGLLDLLEQGSPLLAVIAGVAAGLATLGVVSLIGSLGGLAGMLGKTKAAFAALNTVMRANPIGLVVTAIAALVAAFITAYKTNEEFRAKVDKAWAVIKEKSAEVFTAVSGVVNSAKETIIGAIAYVKGIPGTVSDIGKNMVQGLWQGIAGAKEWLLGKIKDWCGSILGGIKGFFGIKSPSRVMRDEVGVMLGRGVAEGVDDSVKYVQKSARRLGDAMTKQIQQVSETLAKAEKEALAAQAKGELDNYQKALGEKYKALETAEKSAKEKLQKEIEKLESDWAEKQKQNSAQAAKEALEAQLTALQDFQAEYEAAIESIETKQDGMYEKLAGYGELMKTVKTETGEYLTLGDLQGEIDMITRYGDALAGLKARGVSDDLLAEITNMGVEDAVGYTEKLLGMTDKEYAKYMTLWAEKQKKAQEVAQGFYRDELEALDKEFVGKIPLALSGLKSEMNNIGMYSAQGLAEGFSGQYESIKSSFVSTISAALDAAREEMGVHSPSTVWAAFGANLAAGLEVGFTGRMRDASRDINAAIARPLDAATNGSVLRAAEATVNGMAMSNPGLSQPVILQVQLDKRTIAQTIFDPLRDVSRQRGVSLG